MNLNQVTLPARDVAAAAAFYQRLGLRLMVDALPRYVRFECPDGDGTLSVEQASDGGAGPAPVVYFECEDLVSGEAVPVSFGRCRQPAPPRPACEGSRQPCYPPS
jgi:catechol 2,3-dioxygenase-like lactoylglutathione lyase family enzyme